MSNGRANPISEKELRAIFRATPTQLEVESAMGKLRQLMSRTLTIGLFVRSLRGSYESSLARGFRAAASAFRCNIRVFVGNEFNDRRVLLDEIARNQIDGAIIASAALGLSAADIECVCEELMKEIQARTVVSVGVDVPGVRSITIDDAPKIEALVEHYLDRHGFKRIAFIGGPASNEQAARRWLAYHATMSRHNLKPAAVRGDFQFDSGIVAARDLLRDDPSLEAIICANDRMALGALRSLYLQGLERNVKISGFDDGSFADAGCFTTVDQDPEQQGFRAMELLMAQMNGEPYLGSQQVATRLVIGRLCGCGASNDEEGLHPHEIMEILNRWRTSSSEGQAIEDLANEFVDAVYSGYFNPFLSHLAQMTVSALREDVVRWQRILGELRYIVEHQSLGNEIGYVALRALGEATNLVALAEQRAWLEFEARQDQVDEMSRQMRQASTEAAIWDIAEQQFAHIVGSFEIRETSTIDADDGEAATNIVSNVLISRTASHGIAMAVTSEQQPTQTIVIPISLGARKRGMAVFGMESTCDWSIQEKLAFTLQAGIQSAQETERLRRAHRLDEDVEKDHCWSETAQTRLGLVASFVRESLRCDIVTIYPYIGETIPVENIGPAVAGNLHFPEKMTQTVHASDAVGQLLQHGETVRIDDTKVPGPFTHWFVRPGRTGFQEREGIASLSGHILRWGKGGNVVGVMFCNYRRFTNLGDTAEFCDRLVEHAALALAQELRVRDS